MKLSNILEAKYAANESWWDLMPRTFAPGTIALKFAQENKKILGNLFEELKKSFFFFWEMSVDMMDDQPDDYEERHYDAERIASYWWDQYNGNFEDESHIYDFLSKRVNKSMLDDVMGVMADYIVQHAQKIIDEA